MIKIRDLLSDNDRGVVNLAALAVALPIFILICVAAVDIIRLPVVKQQIQGALHGAFDAMIYDRGAAKDWPELAVGMNSCAIAHSDSLKLKCPPCRETKPPRCTGAKDKESGESGCRNAVAYLVRELSEGGSGLFRQNKEQISVTAAVYNLIVDQEGSVVGMEKVAVHSGSGLGATLEHEIDLNDLVHKKLVSPRPNLGLPLGRSEDGDSKSMHVSLAVLNTAVRVRHIFPFSKAIRVQGSDTSQTTVGNNESILVSTLIRPLPRPLRLGGPLKR